MVTARVLWEMFGVRRWLWRDGLARVIVDEYLDSPSRKVVATPKNEFAGYEQLEGAVNFVKSRVDS